jgi:hypothetical protein
MEPQVLEGTISEVQRQLSDLPCAPDMRVRVTVEEAGPKAPTKRTRNGITLFPVVKTDSDVAETKPPVRFRPTEFRNGVPLLTHRETAEPLTTEFVKRLQGEEDEEWLRAHRPGGC